MIGRHSVAKQLTDAFHAICNDEAACTQCVENPFPADIPCLPETLCVIDDDLRRCIHIRIALVIHGCRADRSEWSALPIRSEYEPTSMNRRWVKVELDGAR